MKRRLMIPIAFALAVLAPVLAYGSAASAQAGKAVAPEAPAAAPCTQFYLGRQAPTGGPSGRIICHSFYAISYSTSLRNPVWTSYRMTRAMAAGGDRIGRFSGQFRQDAALTAAEQGAHRDYANPPYDRGHLTPANDAIDMPHQSDTFVITNVVPQISQLNQRLWRFLEASVHQLAATEGEVFVVTGATYAASPPLMHKAGRPDRIAVPDATFKAIFVPSRNVAIGYIATNADPTVCTVMSIAELARRTGVNPFPSLPAAATAEMPAFTLPAGPGTDPPDCRPAAATATAN
jgi:endonuclease G, mitochondrial